MNTTHLVALVHGGPPAVDGLGGRAGAHLARGLRRLGEGHVGGAVGRELRPVVLPCSGGALPVGLPEELEAGIAVVADLPRRRVGAAAHVHVSFGGVEGYECHL